MSFIGDLIEGIFDLCVGLFAGGISLVLFGAFAAVVFYICSLGFSLVQAVLGF